MSNPQNTPIQNQANSIPEPIDWSSVTQLPPVTDTTQQTPTLCTEGMGITRSFETFNKHNNDE